MGKGKGKGGGGISAPKAPAPAPAPPRPANVQASYVDAGSNKSYATRFIPNTGRDGKGVWTAGPMSDDQVRALYGGSGGGGSTAASNSVGATSNVGSRQQAIRNAKNLGQGIKIALSNDGLLGTKEIRNLQKSFDAGSLKIDQKLNDLNSRRGAELGYGGYKANAWNQFNTGKLDTPSDKRSRLYGSMLNRTLGNGVNTKFGLGVNVDPTFQKLAKGWSAMNVPGAGVQYRQGGTDYTNGWSKYSSLYRTPTDTGTGIGGDSAPPVGGDGIGDVAALPTLPMEELPPPEETKVPSYGVGEDLFSTATGFKSNRSSRRRGGASAQGFNSMTIAPQYANNVGLNTGYQRALQS